MTLPPRSALVLACACGLLVALVLVRRTPPEQSRFLPPCMFHRATGLHCPGCGSTRAVHAVLNLRFGEALKKNALFTAALPFLSAWAACGLWRWARREPLPESRWLQRPAVAWIMGVLLLGFGVLRNLPWPPFTLLAPH